VEDSVADWGFSLDSVEGEQKMVPRVTTALRVMAVPNGRKTKVVRAAKIASAIFIVRLQHGVFSVGGAMEDKGILADLGLVACMI